MPFHTHLSERVHSHQPCLGMLKCAGHAWLGCCWVLAPTALLWLAEAWDFCSHHLCVGTGWGEWGFRLGLFTGMAAPPCAWCVGTIRPLSQAEFVISFQPHSSPWQLFHTPILQKGKVRLGLHGDPEKWKSFC